MNQKRAQEILKHLIEDKNHGFDMIKTLSLAESIYVAAKILPVCINEAREKENENDTGYFEYMLKSYRPLLLKKIKEETKLWIIYSEATGYPYTLDQDMIILFDYQSHKDIQEKLKNAGFSTALLDLDSIQLKNEVGHMYRNGIKRIRFMDGKIAPFIVEREELYSYEEIFREDYITNPALQQTMLTFFQEYRKKASYEGRESMLKKYEDEMIKNILKAEYMVPCEKHESEDKVEISHPFIDITDQIKSEEEGPIIVIPAFTDEFEMNKCYTGKREAMLYSFKDLKELTDELEASGIIINYQGTGYFISKEMMEKISRR